MKIRSRQSYEGVLLHLRVESATYNIATIHLEDSVAATLREEETWREMRINYALALRYDRYRR